MVSKKNKVSTPEKILKQSSLRQFFKTATPSPVRMPPLARRSMFDEKEKAPPPSPIVFNIDDVVDEKPKPHEVLFVNPEEDDDHNQVHLTFQKKLDAINNPHLAAKYGIGASTLARMKLLKDSYQKQVNQGNGNRYRVKPPQLYKQGMDATDKYMNQILDNGNAITKTMCMKKLYELCKIKAPGALEDRYRYFKRHFNWRWRRFGKMRCIVPQDLEARIKRWHGVVWWHHTIRKYKYVVFDDELCLVKEGAANGKTLVKGTGTQPKIFGEDEKGSVTVLLAGVADMETGIAKPLPPMVIFQSTAKNRERSAILKEVTDICKEVGGIHADVTESGWVTSESYKRWYDIHLPLDASAPPTLNIDDTYNGHIVSPDLMPRNVDRFPIPGGATSSLQVHDKIINAIFLREYENLLRELLSQQCQRHAEAGYKTCEGSIQCSVEAVR